MLFNQNVYKTKTEIKLKRVYDLKTRKAMDENISYVIKLDNVNMVRYRIMKDGDKPYLKLLPAVKFVFNSPSQVDIEVADADDPYFQSNPNPTTFIFQATEDLEPNQKFLATEKISGLPITMPIKFRRLNGKTQMKAGFNVGYAFGWKVRMNANPYRENYLNFIPFAFGIGVDEHIARKDDGTFTEGEESFVLNYWTLGVTYQFSKMNVGVFTGWDRMFNDRTNWVYQKKSWLSLGLGYKIGD